MVHGRTIKIIYELLVADLRIFLMFCTASVILSTQFKIWYSDFFCFTFNECFQFSSIIYITLLRLFLFSMCTTTYTIEGKKINVRSIYNVDTKRICIIFLLFYKNQQHSLSTRNYIYSCIMLKVTKAFFFFVFSLIFEDYNARKRLISLG